MTHRMSIQHSLSDFGLSLFKNALGWHVEKRGFEKGQLQPLNIM